MYPERALERLRQSTVLIAGLGGVGSWAVEALSRSGIGTLILLDYDRISASNMNRQLFALESTLGRFKCEVAKERIHDIDPEIRVITLNERLDKGEADRLFDKLGSIDYVVDAIDHLDGKIDLLISATRRHIPVISSMGMGNRRDPSQLSIACLSKTHTDPFARIIRQRLRKESVEQLKVVFSKETPTVPQNAGAIGSTPVVPPVAGFLLASEVIRDLTLAETFSSAHEPDA
ncbi:MAG: tRNA threonylcarbamoyladenosine dehydratase [Eubacteriales bacterium]|nr:tRNA threonylcarbamoyladenosine dehydratase [Eubacteriales bacterium]MDD3540684.1 tRNA threonylcarbamoyladenosine dehydratase [Eubacteriales bacterium]MDD4186780.1 tRNA threonylcarbamoyladenosine dehydratase [Eubacteriales bacterium]